MASQVGRTVLTRKGRSLKAGLSGDQAAILLAESSPCFRRIFPGPPFSAQAFLKTTGGEDRGHPASEHLVLREKRKGSGEKFDLGTRRAKPDIDRCPMESVFASSEAHELIWFRASAPRTEGRSSFWAGDRERFRRPFSEAGGAGSPSQRVWVAVLFQEKTSGHS
jgi:hypothetical protein